MILKGEHLFVTGGAAGIGEAIVLGAVKEGAKVSFVDIDDAKANALVDKLTKEGKESNVVNILELTPERIQRISRAMEGRCDVTSNNNIGNSLSEEDKDIVANIIDSVYSVNNMKEIIGQLSKEHLKLVDAIALQKSKNSFNSDEEIKLENDVNTMADILSISQEEDIIKNLSYDIKQIIKSYFGFNDNNNDCWLMNWGDAATWGIYNRNIDTTLTVANAVDVKANSTAFIGSG